MFFFVGTVLLIIGSSAVNVGEVFMFHEVRTSGSTGCLAVGFSRTSIIVDMCTISASGRASLIGTSDRWLVVPSANGFQGCGKVLYLCSSCVSRCGIVLLGFTNGFSDILTNAFNVFNEPFDMS